MARPDIRNVAFARPGGEAFAPSRSRPIDMAHLAQQTMGDSVLEQDVLAMFVQQATMVQERLMTLRPDERSRLAHSLKGSARGIGAFAVAECVEAIEHNPQETRLVRTLATRIEEVRDFIAAINR